MKIGLDRLKEIIMKHQDTEVIIERYGKITNKCKWMIRFTLPSYGGMKVECESKNPKAQEIVMMIDSIKKGVVLIN